MAANRLEQAVGRVRHVAVVAGAARSTRRDGACVCVGAACRRRTADLARDTAGTRRSRRARGAQLIVRPRARRPRDRPRSDASCDTKRRTSCAIVVSRSCSTATRASALYSRPVARTMPSDQKMSRMNPGSSCSSAFIDRRPEIRGRLHDEARLRQVVAGTIGKPAARSRGARRADRRTPRTSGTGRTPATSAAGRAARDARCVASDAPLRWRA